MSIPEQIESDFIIKLHHGDGEAFAQLHNEYHSDIYFHIKKLVGDPDIASGIVTDAFGKFWEKKNNFPSIANIRSFLYTTSRNLAIDWLRRKNIQPDIIQSSFTTPDAVILPTIEAEMIKAQVYKLLNNALDNLEPEQKLILKRLFLEEKSIKEICLELNITEHTAWARKSRALKKMREQNNSLFSFFRKLQFSPILSFL